MRLQDIRNRIRAIRGIDLKTADLSFLAKRIHPLFDGLVVTTPILNVGQKVYRAVKWDQKYSTVSRLTYPPADKVTKYQRVNAPGKPMFYCSVAWNAPLFELQLKPGDQIALSRWRVNQQLIVNNVGYTDTVFRRLNSDRSAVQAWDRRDQQAQTPANRTLLEFLSKEFAREVPENSDYLYKLSIAIAEIFLHDMHDDDRIEGVPDMRMAGLLYPALAMLGHSDNLALKPDVVSKYLAIEQVEFMQIDTVDVDKKDKKYVTYKNTHLDFANTFSPDGAIEWKGRVAQWNIVIPPGGLVRSSIENGRQVYRNESGDIIEPG